jgi:carboxyl-terminal processing protease
MGSTAPGGPSPDPTLPTSARSELRRSIFNAAWTLVRDKHYDKTLGGLDWIASREKYEPLALAAPDEPTFYRLMNEMLGQLGQSHLEITGPGAQARPVMDEVRLPASKPRSPQKQEAEEPAIDENPTDAGDPGIVVRLIEGQPTITSVRPGSSADRAGLRAGVLVTHIGGREIKALPPSSRALRPVEERFYFRLAAARRLTGPVGSRVSIRYIDGSEPPAEALLRRDPAAGKAVQVGLLPPLHPQVKVTQIGDVGIIAFNFFLLDPVLGEVQRAIDGFRQRGAKGLILDLRGNPGGVGAMAIPVAARLVTKPLTLGTIQYREYSNSLTATPPLGVKPFVGRVVILTDEGTASTSEILAGLQEAKRAVIVGDSTLGAVLPSIIESLPGGAVMQFVVADFRTPKGILLEGRGVQPDRRVLETRAALRSGRDPVLDTALTVARAGGAP